jgi:hypothetical protein
MQYQVITFEGLEPIVTTSQSNEVNRLKQIHGLTYNHPFTASFFMSHEEALSSLEPKTETPISKESAPEPIKRRTRIVKGTKPSETK